MDELYRIPIRAVLGFIVLHALVRASGKRTVHEGTAFDFTLALILGDMFDDILWAEVPASQFATAVAVLVLAHTAVSLVAYHSQPAHRVITGEPALVVEDGAFVHAAMQEERLAPWDLDALLRQQGVAAEDRRQVHEARIETSGQMSVLKHRPGREAQKRDVQ